MTKHKISRRDFLAALAAGTVAATACGVPRAAADQHALVACIGGLQKPATPLNTGC